jgi:Zn-finger nucleic acid-binding protein
MRCPAGCDADLLLTERRGVEIDYCPRCRGIWLDRGELDKIIDRAAEEVDRIVERERATAPPQPAPAQSAPPAPPVPEWSSEYDDRGRDRWASSSGGDATRSSGKTGKKPKSKKKKAFDLLEDIFDF